MALEFSVCLSCVVIWNIGFGWTIFCGGQKSKPLLHPVESALIAPSHSITLFFEISYSERKFECFLNQVIFGLRMYSVKKILSKN